MVLVRVRGVRGRGAARTSSLHFLSDPQTREVSLLFDFLDTSGDGLIGPDELEAAIRTVCEPYFDRPLKEISLGMVLTPGPNMIYLISRSISQGRAAGMVWRPRQGRAPGGPEQGV